MRLDLDHVAIDVRTALDEAARFCERLGFQVTPASENSLGSINRLCVFGTTYLELLAVGPRSVGEQRARLAEPIGARGLVLRTGDAAALATRLHAHGIATGPARAFSRPVTIDGQPREARFETLHLDAAETRPLRTYFCRHLTPELIWREPWTTHPNGARDVIGVVLVAADAVALRSRFDALAAAERDGCGRIAPERTGVRLAVLDLAEAARCYGERASASPHGAAIAELTIASNDLHAVEAFALASDRPTTVAADRIVVDGLRELGVVFTFVQPETR